MSWRPERWEIPREVEDKSFEKGADAMLEALRKQGQHLPAGSKLVFPFRAETVGANGVLVFIPDEES